MSTSDTSIVQPTVTTQGSYPLYHYQALTNATCIRLICITRQTPSSGLDMPSLRMHLVEVDLDDPDRPEYHCLSYTWGPAILPKESDSNPPSVQAEQQAWFVNNCAVTGQALIPITPSLQEFFTYLLLRPHSIRFLWIDAICINQKDQVERSAQVQMMARVYSSCIQTVAWLGPEDDDSRAALPIITAIARNSDELTELVLERHSHGFKTNSEAQKEAQKDQQMLGIDNLVPENEQALDHFLKRSWFSRKWTVQETVLPPAIVFWCGEVPEFRPNHLRTAMNVTLPWGRLEVAGIFGHDPVISYRMMVQRSLNDFYLDQFLKYCGIYPEDRSAGSLLVLYARPRQCSNARDAIYSILGLLSPNTGRITVDYNKSVAEVFIEFAATHAFENLFWDGATRKHRKTPDLPSWVPDYAVSSMIPSFYACGGFSRFSACGSDPTTISLPEILLTPNERVIAVRGIMVDTVAYAARPSDRDRGRYLADALELLDRLPWTNLSPRPPKVQEDIMEAFWRTLIADAVDEKRPDAQVFGPSFAALLASQLGRWINKTGGPETLEARALKSTLASLSTKTRLNLLPSWDTLLALSAAYTHSSGDNRVFHILEALSLDFRTLLEINYQDKCFFTTENGRMGLGTEDVNFGTLVYVVDRSHYLFLLDRVTGDLKPDNRHELLGLGYVHGLMFGEGLLDGREYQRIEIE